MRSNLHFRPPERGDFLVAVRGIARQPGFRPAVSPFQAPIEVRGKGKAQSAVLLDPRTLRRSESVVAFNLSGVTLLPRRYLGLHLGDINGVKVFGVRGPGSVNYVRLLTEVCDDTDLLNGQEIISNVTVQYQNATLEGGSFDDPVCEENSLACCVDEGCKLVTVSCPPNCTSLPYRIRFELSGLGGSDTFCDCSALANLRWELTYRSTAGHFGTMVGIINRVLALGIAPSDCYWASDDVFPDSCGDPPQREFQALMMLDSVHSMAWLFLVFGSNLTSPTPGALWMYFGIPLDEFDCSGVNTLPYVGSDASGLLICTTKPSSVNIFPTAGMHVIDALGYDPCLKIAIPVGAGSCPDCDPCNGGFVARYYRITLPTLTSIGAGCDNCEAVGDRSYILAHDPVNYGATSHPTACVWGVEVFPSCIEHISGLPNDWFMVLRFEPDDCVWRLYVLAGDKVPLISSWIYKCSTGDFNCLGTSTFTLEASGGNCFGLPAVSIDVEAVT